MALNFALSLTVLLSPRVPVSAAAASLCHVVRSSGAGASGHLQPFDPKQVKDGRRGEKRRQGSRWRHVCRRRSLCCVLDSVSVSIAHSFCSGRRDERTAVPSVCGVLRMTKRTQAIDGVVSVVDGEWLWH